MGTTMVGLRLRLLSIFETPARANRTSSSVTFGIVVKVRDREVTLVRPIESF